MTVSDRLKKFLTENGLWPKEADEVLTGYRSTEAVKDVRFDFDSDESGYPTAMLAVLTIAIKRHAAEWLAIHKPKHWARPMFDDELMAEVEKATAPPSP